MKIFGKVVLQLNVVDGPPVDVNPIAAFSPSLLFPILIQNVFATRLNLTLMPPALFHSHGIRMPTSTLALGRINREENFLFSLNQGLIWDEQITGMIQT